MLWDWVEFGVGCMSDWGYIVKSQLHLDLEAENQRKNEYDMRIKEQRQLGMLIIHLFELICFDLNELNFGYR